ncbi:MAG: hypothetical protein NC453_15085 [Muribaculum sp.]|nr:hypothetical protein [Muribaculum sp.]
MQDLPPPEKLVPGNNAGTLPRENGAKNSKTIAVISQHEFIVACVFGCPFMVAMFDGRYDDMPGHYHGFRKLLSDKCNDITIAAHDAHIAMLHIQDEIAYFVETVSDKVVRILNRALSMIRDFINHLKLRIKYPRAEAHSIPLSQNEISSLQALASSGKLNKKQIIALGCSVYEAAFLNSGIQQTEFIVELGKFFNMKISESYARTAITDIRNDFKDGVPPYFSIFGERLTSKMKKLNQDSDEAYDRKVREARLSKSVKK